MKVKHKEEIKIFARAVKEDEVKFACYGELLTDWKQNRAPKFGRLSSALRPEILYYYEVIVNQGVLW